MKALVTGGCGLIGSHIVDRLRREGFSVRILDNLSPRPTAGAGPPGFPRTSSCASAR